MLSYLIFVTRMYFFKQKGHRQLYGLEQRISVSDFHVNFQGCCPRWIDMLGWPGLASELSGSWGGSRNHLCYFESCVVLVTQCNAQLLFHSLN